MWSRTITYTNMPKMDNPRTMTVTTASGKDVKDTQQLKGEAKDSLSGKNVTKQHYNSGPAAPGPHGGKPSNQ